MKSKFDTSRMPDIRKGMPSSNLDEETFKNRFRQQFLDPQFGTLEAELKKIANVAWRAYSTSRKSPKTRRAGDGFSDPDHELSFDWLATRDNIAAAQIRHDDESLPARILLINGSSRSEHTCPGEMSKSYRLVEIARSAILDTGQIDVEVLDLSRLASEYGRNIHPCKACFSTAAPLCHWPCSCYPNLGLGQTQDWMNEIYPMWVAAHGIMIVTPVNWYQVSSPLKLMMDRLTCADGGNPDPTSTHGKHANEAKALEMAGWHYPRHLEGRLFSVVVHGDVEGAENVRRLLVDWLAFMRLAPAAAKAQLDRYIGYWQPYATSHLALDEDRDIQKEVANAGKALASAVIELRRGKFPLADAGLSDPRSK
ncbi:NADPH-dependent FMN reductase [Aminobacter sp. DSM 101952]|uniref:flavodoxin family protein n=1 Tax=Aminobacter sp. DSM 101952 TaxID=2735891 RepID=UPI0006F78135|nr:flavodoxin family protein [Aminobacter sp. DSM 101952]KQU74454.1 NADPH-dependent FMN reductase [Aminobacter sp. DSM 101952]